jgi:hypothetical protein
MKRQVKAGGKVEVRRAAEKRQQAEGEAHDEAEKIKV